jgi:hypothetical protein
MERIPTCATIIRTTTASTEDLTAATGRDPQLPPEEVRHLIEGALQRIGGRRKGDFVRRPPRLANTRPGRCCPSFLRCPLS